MLHRPIEPTLLSDIAKTQLDLPILYGILILPTTGRYFQVPYRTMLVKEVENLLVAGRATGGDRDSHAATRNMMCCTVTGQGAGVAAAISVKHEQSLSDISIDTVQKELCRQGVRLN